MNNIVTSKFSPQLIDEVDQLVHGGMYRSRAEVLRDGARHIVNEAKELKK